MALRCPVCEGRVSAPLVDINGVPVHVSALHRTPGDARRAPRADLRLAFCDDCGYIWNAGFDSSIVTYDADYENSLDHSPAFKAYASGLAARLVDRYDLRGRRVVEIGCGQADFLHRLCDAGAAQGLGYDPTYIGPASVGPVRVRRELYAEDTVREAAPDFLCCRHVLEHVERPLEFMRSVRRTLDAGDGTPVFFEVPNGEHQLANGVVWDMIYAHYSTFTEPSLRALFELTGFEVVETGTSFGEQYLWIEARPAGVTPRVAPDLTRLRDAFTDFGAGYRRQVRAWRDRVARYEDAGHQVVLWGAGAKGASLLNALNGTAATIAAVVDVNPRKQGSYVPGVATPVVAPEALVDRWPDIVVLANPIYRDEVQGILDGLGEPVEIVCV